LDSFNGGVAAHFSDINKIELLKDIGELIKLSGSIQKTMRLKLENKTKNQ